MSASQKRAVENHRRRMNERGMARYEVRGLAKDKALVREFAKRLATNDAEAERLRESVAQKVANERPRTGKDIWDALRRSPLVGLDLDIEREFTTGRDVDL
jgi:hypothetical protein